MLTWLLTPWLAIKFGYLGAAVGLGVVPASSVIVFGLAKKKFGLNVWRTILVPLIATLAMMGTLTFWKLSFYPASWLGLIGFVCGGAGVYLGLVWLLAKNELIRLVRVVKDGFVG